MSAVAALWLTACGGGGDSPAPAPAPAPASAAAVRITGLTQQAESNTAYTVAAASAGTVVITLPPAPQPGDTVSVTGESANSWQIAQNADQTVLTSGMNGHVAPGTVWTPRLTPKMWHWISSNSGGDVLVAGEGPGNLHTSSDGGATWTVGNSPAGFTWISSDMTPTANRIVAVQYGGGLYMSADRGTTWTQITTTDPGVNLSAQSFESVNISQDGLRIVVAVQNGPIYVSSNAGQNWTVATLVGGGALTGWWRSVDGSADGMILMAADHNGVLYRSTDGGATWATRNVVIGGVTVSDSWYRLKMSADGQDVAVVGNSFGTSAAGTGIYISPDSGATWTKATSLVADYSAVAMSSDGQVITVTVSDPNAAPPAGTPPRATGRVLRSTDGGATFAELDLPGAETNWRAVATSYDGNKLAVAAGTFGTVTGQLYTSLGNRTEMGTLGSITGGQGQTAELEYVGNGQFRVRSSAGGAFTIQ